MASPKLLLGGLVGVGSVSTAAVVAHQQGFFPSFSKQTQSSGDTASAETPSPSEARQDTVVDEKPNQKAVEKWLTDNGGSGKWEIKIKKSPEAQEKGFKETEIEESDLNGLFDYLNSNKELLKSLFSALETKSLTFEKTGSDWKHILTKENIEKWIEVMSGTKATLKLAKDNTPQEISSLTQELNDIFGGLFSKKDVFEAINTEKPDSNKNVLFEKIENAWKHSKTEITSWLTNGKGNNKFTVQIQNDTALESAKEEGLIGLWDYLEKNKDELFLFTTESTPTPLTFKKENSNWDVVHNETTINNWVSNVSEKKVSLEVWKDDTKQQLSAISGELKQLLADLKKAKEKKLFTENLGNASATNPKTIIFEKDSESWIHIKEAIEKFLNSKSWDKSKIKIEKGDPKTQTEISKIDDSELVGLLKHLKGQESSYNTLLTTGATDLVLKKKAGSSTNEWEQVTNSPGE